MPFAWLGTAVASILVVIAALWGCYEWQRRHEAARIVIAIETEDDEELRLLLAERTNFRSVAEWFGEPALIILTKSFTGASGDATFVRDAVGLLISFGANVNEPGTEWRTALMYAAGNGDRDLCITLLSHGADVTAHDMFGRTPADWARIGGHDRIASLLRRV
jgi:hypothetical protein